MSVPHTLRIKWMEFPVITLIIKTPMMQEENVCPICCVLQSDRVTAWLKGLTNKPMP